ncbi:histone-like nucleoid-structuring protein Lsr2 [Streptomyces sp. NBC_01751]|uniref:histone-like nucleoid-structuring protein Lsr2 n=1 Tax=Streptomyces sp. NBC_01751 TaxID=2975929 RepID=UPI002DDB3A5E|nr:Lsr2 family protein [Streptomyces sp. NBC_01751]WSD23367.1 Lsr2 family protein [Streptomyces sp. NBC_01751]
MAQKVQILLTDDLDGTDAVETIPFGLDGTAYEIDLNEDNAATLREALAPFLGAARKLKGASAGRTVRRMGTGAPKDDTASIRAWAKAEGFTVNDRGRVPANIREAYEKAQPKAA